MQYCRYSAMPVGRFVLDVHGERQIVWPSSDALCSALQVINHLQDCAKDYRALDRVYMPLERSTPLARRRGARRARASPALRACLAARRPDREVMQEPRTAARVRRLPRWPRTP